MFEGGKGPTLLRGRFGYLSTVFRRRRGDALTRCANKSKPLLVAQ